MSLNLEKINHLQPTQIARDEDVKNKFIAIHDKIHGEGTGETAYEREVVYFNQILGANESLQRATRFSIFSAFIELAVNGLSLRPGAQAQCYLQPRSYRAGKDSSGRDVWETRCSFTVSGYGEIYLRMRAGQIRHADNPVIVYEEDTFSFSDNNGQKSISYTCRLPHTSGKISAVYMRITRADGTNDYAIMLPDDWMRLADFSKKQNRGTANELYSSHNGGIDPGFLMAKCIKHAFKTYPKISLGRATLLETQIDEQSNDDVYGFSAEPAATIALQPEVPSFHEAPQVAGVVINPEAQGNATEDDGAF